MLSWFPERLRGSHGFAFQITGYHQDQELLTVDLDIHMNNGHIPWSITCHRVETSLTLISHYFDKVWNRFSFANIKNNYLPLIVYYPVQRSVPTIPLEIDHPIDFTDYLAAFTGSLDANINFQSFFVWYRQREDLEQEKIREQLDRGTLPKKLSIDPQLESVRQAIKNFTTFTDLRVRRSPLHMEIKKRGETLWVDHLSNGEKCLLSMAGDLARRLSILSRGTPNPLQGRGVVLIDEIDLHLHPAWQRNVIPKLVETFPNCQFIISTHSPQVISDINPENVFLLHQEEGNITLAHPEVTVNVASAKITVILSIIARREA